MVCTQPTRVGYTPHTHWMGLHTQIMTHTYIRTYVPPSPSPPFPAVCQLIETVRLGPLGLLALVRTKDNFQVMEYNHGGQRWTVKSTLPTMIPNSDFSHGNGRWIVLEGNSTSAEPTDQQSLCLSRVYLVSGHILALAGNQLLLR